jgi:hypothetical protein
VTARAFARAIERILDPSMKSDMAADLAPLLVGGDDVLTGKATRVSGVVARGRTLTLTLRRRVSDFAETWIAELCAVPPTLPVDPEGARAPGLHEVETNGPAGR